MPQEFTNTVATACLVQLELPGA